MLVHDELRPLGAANISQTIRKVLPRAVLGLLLLASAVTLRQIRTGHGPASHVAAASDMSPSPYDVAPSVMRQWSLDRRDAGLPPPSPGALLLQEQVRQNAIELQQEKDLVSKYFSEIQNRDSDIAKLNQTVQWDQANLAKLAAQLGLPKEQIAPAAPPSQKGIGAATPLDLAALANTQVPSVVPGGIVKSVQDLQALVARYLSIWCPLAAGAALCGQAVDHARAQLARGHGLDLNKPDASPVLRIDVAQPFGPTAEAMEPLQMLNGRLVHFHDGVDLAVNYDEPVMAAAGGTVVFADVSPSGALTVEIAHAGGIHTVYMHEEQLLVTQGQSVEKGQIIGLVGSTGMSTGPHVHFMIKDPSGTPIDPLPFIQ